MAKAHAAIQAAAEVVTAAVGLNLVNASHGQVMRELAPWIGRMVQPDQCGSVEATAVAGVPWAADNGCFRGLRPRPFQSMLERLAGLPGCLFVVVPDVVADHTGTMRRWRRWRGRVVQLAGQPLAFVAQNGAHAGNVPWDELDCLFLGGDTDWKLGPAAGQLAWDAAERGKWVHMGRVNSHKRILRALATRCDSFDGTKWSRWSVAHRPTADDAQHTPVTLVIPGT